MKTMILAVVVGLAAAGSTRAGTTNAELQGITDKAAHQVSEAVQGGGLIGLRRIIEECYSNAIPTRRSNKVMLCISEDLQSRGFATALGEDAEPPFFRATTMKPRVEAALKALGEQDSNLLDRINASGEESDRHILASRTNSN